MCIRDSDTSLQKSRRLDHSLNRAVAHHGSAGHHGGLSNLCLLYTSDAADERSSVDLGGRRIIKKKKREEAI